MPDDPFSTPVTSSIETELPRVQSEPRDQIARRTFLAWEKLRLACPATLVCVTLATAWGMLAVIGNFEHCTDPEFWMTVVAGTVFTNLACFHMNVRIGP